MIVTSATPRSTHRKVDPSTGKRVKESPPNTSQPVADGIPHKRDRHLDRLQSTQAVVRLAKEIPFRIPPKAPTPDDINRLAETARTLAGCVNHIKAKVDARDLEPLTRPGNEHPDWQRFAQKTAAQLPKRRTKAEQKAFLKARRAQRQADNKLPLADQVEKRIREAEKAKAARETTSKMEVLTSGLETGGNPRREEAEKKLLPEERALAPLLSSVQTALACSNAVLLQLCKASPEAKELSAALKTAVQEQKGDLTLQGSSPEDLPGQLLVQPFARLPMLTDNFNQHLKAAEKARQELEAARSAGVEPTAEQIKSAQNAQKRLEASAGEIITTYENTFRRLTVVGELFTNMKGLPPEQLKAVHDYGHALLTYAAMLALPRSVPTQLMTLAHAVRLTSAPTKPQPPIPTTGRPLLNAAISTIQAQDGSGLLLQPLAPPALPETA